MSTVELDLARVAVLETKVEGIKEDIVEIKNDIKIVHTRVDNTAIELKSQLSWIYFKQFHNVLESMTNQPLAFNAVTITTEATSQAP